VISSTTKTVTAAFAIAAALGATTVQSASAKNGDGIRVAGKCSVSSTSKLKVKHDDRRLQVEFEVDQNHVGVPWTVEIRKDGQLVIQGTRQTLAPSGSFSLERHIAGTTGTITARATRSGEVCTATAQAPKAVQAAAASATQGAAATTQRADDNGNHAVVDDSGHHTAGSGTVTGADDKGHHGSDD
jgi:hypothetical protein